MPGRQRNASINFSVSGLNMSVLPKNEPEFWLGLNLHDGD